MKAKRIPLVLSTAIGVIVLVVILAAVIRLGAIPGPPRPPSIHFTEKAFDAGLVDSGLKEITHSFHFRNEGDEILKILDVKSSCGCTVIDLERKEFRPGEQGAIRVKMTLPLQGSRDALITLSTSDPENSSVRLKIEARKKFKLTIAPQRLYFGEMVSSKAYSREVNIFCGNWTDEPELKILSLSCENPKIRGTIVKRETIDRQSGEGLSREKITVRVDIQQGLPVGDFRSDLVVRTNDPNLEEIFVAIEGRVVGRFKVIPPSLVFGIVKQGETVTRNVTISSTTAEKFTIGGLDTKTSEIVLASPPKEPAESFSLPVKFTGRDVGTIRGEIRVNVTAHQMACLTISVLAIVKGRL